MYTFFKFFFPWYFKWTGWKVVGGIPDSVDKAVLVAGGHTSNWDLIMTLGTLFTIQKPFSFMIKSEALRFPLKKFLFSMGAIPVVRDPSKKTNYVDQMAQIFSQRETCYLCIAAEGTRKAVKKWKSGYYHIAKEAGVPLILCYLDYPKKEAHVGLKMEPLESEEATTKAMKTYFQAAVPKYPELFEM